MRGMSITRVDAEDGKAITLLELRRFIEVVDRRHGDVNVDALVPKVRISFGGKIKSILVEEER